MLGRGAIAGLVVASLCALPATAAAEPVSFAHGTLENRFTTTQPNAAAGSSYRGDYHAAGDPEADPPYMRRMVFHPPTGMRYDTSVPERCTAGDIQLQLQGAAACPEGSRIGGGTARGKAFGSETTLRVDVFNNAGEQVMLISSPMIASVSRGRIGPDNSVEFASPTCYPALVTCPADNALQLGSDVALQAYTRGGRSYLTTPPKCPKSGRWRSEVRFWWADGTEDAVVSTHPCKRPGAKRAKRKRRR
jgi:hypothetical protein